MENKIQETLHILGKNQYWLAERTGLKVSYLNRIIKKNIPNPGILNCFKIAKALGRSVEELWVLE